MSDWKEKYYTKIDAMDFPKHLKTRSKNIIASRFDDEEKFVSSLQDGSIKRCINCGKKSKVILQNLSEGIQIIDGKIKADENFLFNLANEITVVAMTPHEEGQSGIRDEIIEVLRKNLL